MELDKKTKEEPAEENLVYAIQHFVRYITCECTDGGYYLREVIR